jgi:hypothetical protein
LLFFFFFFLEDLLVVVVFGSPDVGGGCDWGCERPVGKAQVRR